MEDDTFTEDDYENDDGKVKSTKICGFKNSKRESTSKIDKMTAEKNRVYAKTKKEASKRSFERIVRRSFHFIGSFKLQKSVKLPN
jgi:hypothetical protein